MIFALYLAAALGAIGILLMLFARFNPKWQSADSYDSMGPFLLGLVFLCASSLVAVVSGALFLSGLLEGF